MKNNLLRYCLNILYCVVSDVYCAIRITNDASRNTQCARHNVSGSIVILTLWAVLFLSSFALTLGGQVAADYQVANRLKWNVLGDAIAGRVFEDARDVLRNDKTVGYDYLNESWADDSNKFKDISFSGAHYSLIGEDSRYGLTDENGRIDINYATVDVLSRLFQIVGQMTPSDAEETAAYLVDWRDANTLKEGGKENETEDCAKFHGPYSCKNDNFETVWELLWLPNISSDVFDKIQKKVTLYGWSGRVNINTVDADVLRCLGLSYGAAEVIVEARKEKPFKQSSQIIATSGNFNLSGADQTILETLVSSGQIGVISDVYRGELVVDFGGRHKKVISFVVNRNGELKSWVE